MLGHLGPPGGEVVVVREEETEIGKVFVRRVTDVAGRRGYALDAILAQMSPEAFAKAQGHTNDFAHRDVLKRGDLFMRQFWGEANVISLQHSEGNRDQRAGGLECYVALRRACFDAD